MGLAISSEIRFRLSIITGRRGRVWRHATREGLSPTDLCRPEGSEAAAERGWAKSSSEAAAERGRQGSDRQPPLGGVGGGGRSVCGTHEGGFEPDR